jgi:tRNA pseudouridine55 synthase
LDITGDRLYFSGVIPTKEEIVAVLPKFTGEIEQTPPKYSAVKVSGERAYKLAREGKEFELKSKKVMIKNFELLKYEETQAVFRIECSSGTYIRSLVADLGRSLNTFATAELLIRTDIGGFSVSNSLESTKITKDSVLKGIISMDKLSDFGL